MQLMVLSGQNWPKNFFKEDIYCSIEGHHCILPEMFKWRNPPCFLQILFQAFGLLLGKGEFTLCYLLFCIIEQLISLIWNQNQFTELNSKLSLVCTWQRDRDYISLYEFLLGSSLLSLFSSRLSHVKMILFSLSLRSFNRCQLPGFFSYLLTTYWRLFFQMASDHARNEHGRVRVQEFRARNLTTLSL